ncbi:hypothetical protein JI640_03375 [Listeria ivanovii subsp. londoniensis]|uniref:hypothetical protein n=1 Tax=Listeria ivanovii TaxID=1638 RepID=UPI00190523E2|nr:hypothetical protein [Listeria ivanovii]MBK1994972.1 hypothetical protein [Listeria ivanovii subsp. londoniensis]
MNDIVRKIFAFIETPEIFEKSETIDKISCKESCQVKNVKKTEAYKLGQNKGIETTFKIEGENIQSTSIDELISLYTEERYKEIESNLEIKVRISKKIITEEYPEISNLSFFSSLSEAMKQVFSLPWNDANYKQVIYIKDLPENQILSSPYLLISDIEVNKVSKEEIIIKNEFKDIFHEVNNYYESVSLDLYSKLPIAWIDNSTSRKRNITYVLKQIELMMNLVCNKIIAKDIFVIRGYKTITFTVTTDDFTNLEQVEDINKKLFSFLLDKEKFYDKKIILRNTLTLYLNDTSNTTNYVNNCEEIYKSVEYNFNLYVQNKIEVFLEQKNKLLQEFIDVSGKMQDRAQTVSDQLRTVGLSLLGTIFLSLLNNLNMSFSKPMINIVLISYIIYFCINIVLVFFAKSNVKVIKENLRDFVNTFGDIEIRNQNESFTYNDLYEKYLKKPVRNFNVLSVGTIIFLALLIICFSFMYLSVRFDFFPKIIDIAQCIIGI